MSDPDPHEHLLFLASRAAQGSETLPSVPSETPPSVPSETPTTIAGAEITPAIVIETPQDARKIVLQNVILNEQNRIQKIDDKKAVIINHVDADRDAYTQIPLSKYNLNYVFEKKDDRDHLFSSILISPIQSEQLPSSVDLRTDWGDILDQGDLGSCVSNSVAYCVRHVFQKEALGTFNASRLFIYYNGRVLEQTATDEDTGLSVRGGYKSVGSYSTCSEVTWPYNPDKFAIKPSKEAYDAASQHKTFRYLRVRQNINELKKCLKDGYPISFGMTVYDSFMSTSVAQNGIVPLPKPDTEEVAGGHCVTLCGYQDDKGVFIGCNSWGTQWGDKGFFYIPYNYVLNKALVSDLWTCRAFS